MPTYHYRCSQCQQVLLLEHGMLETVTPVCEACGHFCAKVVLSAPVVLDGLLTASAIASAEGAEPVEQAHSCGSACVLHRRHSQEPEADSP